MKLIECIPKELLDATNDFARKLEWARRVPPYEIHKWWARRYSGIIRLFLIYSYSEYNIIKNVDNYHKFVNDLYWNPPRVKNKILLDPFCGGGTILLEGSTLGFRSYGIEINKLQFNILNMYKSLTKLDIADLYNRIILVANQINNKLWHTYCEKWHDALVIHTYIAWKNKSDKFQLKFNEIKRYKTFSYYYCEMCNNIYKSNSNATKCIYCDNEFNKIYNNDFEFGKLQPYALEYYCFTCKTRKIKMPDHKDLKLFNITLDRNERRPIPLLNETRRLINKGFSDFNDLLTNRQIITFDNFLMSFKNTPYEGISKLMVSDALRSCSLLAYYSPKYRKVIPAFIIKSYWMPLQPVELNPLSFINDNSLRPLGRGNIISSFNKLIRAIDYMNYNHNYDYKAYLGDAEDILKKINKKIDIVFTDPPYVDYQFYSDLSLFSLSILNDITSKELNNLLDKELVVRKKSDMNKYKNKLSNIFNLLKRCLKGDGKILITFHHSDKKVIKEIIDIFRFNNLNLDALYPVIGESSGKLSKRKLYIDLLFVLSKKRKQTYYTSTDIWITEEDKKLIDSIGELVLYYDRK